MGWGGQARALLGAGAASRGKSPWWHALPGGTRLEGVVGNPLGPSVPHKQRIAGLRKETKLAAGSRRWSMPPGWGPLLERKRL